MRPGADGRKKQWKDDDEKIPAAVLSVASLSPVHDWTPEQRDEHFTEPEPESNVIYLADYKLH